MLKERLKNPGSYFRFGLFGRKREIERVDARLSGAMCDRVGVICCGITKGMLDKREP